MIELFVLLVILLILILPIQLAAQAIGARNTGVFMCLLALIVAALIQKAVSVFLPQIAFYHPLINPLVSLFLSAFAYMLVLNTSYGKAILIALLQIALTLLILFIIGLLGLGLGASL